MGKKHHLILFLTVLSATSHAIVIVDGVVNGDLDNASPFETLAAAVTYANINPEPVIEIRTNTALTSGVYFAEMPLNHPLTIQAGSGFAPVINGPIHFLPTNDSQLVTLSNLKISTNLDASPTTSPLNVGCNLDAVNCVFDANPSSGKYQPAVTCAVPSSGSESTLKLTSCTLRGHTGLEGGRSCRSYVINDCLIEGVPTALDPKFSLGITNARNFRSNLSSGPRMGSTEGFVEISTPRTVTINNSVVRGGMPLAWPSNTNGAIYYTGENSTFGPVDATNTVFVPLRNNLAVAQSSMVGNANLPQNQNATLTLRHCTFSGLTPETGGIAFGFLYFPGTQPATHSVFNSFFDGPSTNYAIFNPTGTNQTVEGNGNSYNIRPAREVIIAGSGTSGVPFESSQWDYFAVPTTNPAMTDTSGNLLVNDSRIVNHATPLVPAVLTDKDGQGRPMPVGAAFADIGADEINETINASVLEWSIY